MMSESQRLGSLIDITVAVPTYNGADRLPQLLASLRAQINTEGIRWEVLIVDNNSQDNTDAILQQLQTNWLPEVPLRYIFEARQGAAFARQSALREAKGIWVAFVDDDVRPEANWLAVAHQFSQNNPKMGAFSGKIYGSYEVTPPHGFEKIQQFLAIRDHGNAPKTFAPQNLQLPPAASLAIRRKAWLAAVPPEPKLTGKLPGLLVQGDDYEPLLYLHKAGWEIWYVPDLCVHHQIPQNRFNRQYLLELGKGCGLATYSLACILTPRWQRPWLLIRTILGNIRRLTQLYWVHRNQVSDDLVPAFLCQFYWGSLMSPFLAFYKHQG
jgi:glycosyltransferase involved in cell wall biosynthesis